MNIDPKKIVVGVVVLAVVGLVGSALLFRKPSIDKPGAGENNTSQGTEEGGPTDGFVTRTVAPENVVVPEKGEDNAPANVAVPTIQGPAGPNTDSSFRAFDIRAEGGKFMPDTVIVNVKDNLRINITAVDRDYDFVQPDFGFKTVIPKGQTKPVEFGATVSGKFSFYCSLCGGPDSGPIGYIVISK